VLNSLLLDLQGFHSRAVEAYHAAISHLTATSDLCRMWLAYLRRFLNIISGRLPWASELGEASKVNQVKDFLHAVDQAICSLPVKCLLPSTLKSVQMWSDYSCHNEIASVFLSCLPDVSASLAYQRLLQLMPANVDLVLRLACYFYAKACSVQYIDFFNRFDRAAAEESVCH
jgi:hypothetical protein